MRIRRSLLGPLLLTILLGQAPPPTPSDIFSRAAAQTDGTGMYGEIDCELRAVADPIGIHYPSTMELAGRGDIPSIRVLVRFTTTSALNSPNGIANIAADSHSQFLNELLNHVGDAKFALALSRESPKMRAAIAADLGWKPAYLARWYPRTAAALKAAPITPSTPASKVLAAATAREFGSGDLPAETIEMARLQGVNYIKVVNAAARGDIKSLRTLMEMNRFDAASSEGHAAVLSELLRHVGDAKFATALATESVETRNEVGVSIYYDNGFSAPALARWYPRTAAALDARPTPVKKAPAKH